MKHRRLRSLVHVALCSGWLLAACKADNGPSGGGGEGGDVSSGGKGGSGGKAQGGSGGEETGGAGGDGGSVNQGGSGGSTSKPDGSASGGDTSPMPVVSNCNATDKTGIARPFGSHKFTYAKGTL